MFRIFLAQQRASADAAVVTALLRAWLREPPPDETLREPAGLALERLVAATQVRFPAVADLARGVVFAWFAQPLLRRNRARVYADVRDHLRHLDAHPDAPDRAERIAEMVRSTEPLVRLLGQRLVRDDLDNAVMLEVLTRRYYGNKGLDRRPHPRRSRAARSWSPSAPDSSVVSAAVELRRAGRRAARARRAGERRRRRSTPTSTSAGRASRRTPTRWRPRCTEVVGAHPLPPQVRRITATVAGRGGAVMHHHFTFRPSSAGMAEERLIRGLHPYIAQRMQLERLRKFDLTRLPSSDEEVYLFRCVARENPSDDRLVAFAQVRDLTALREHDGRLVALPTAENVIATCARLDPPRAVAAAVRRRASTPTGS